MTKIIQIPSPDMQKVKNPPNIILNLVLPFNIEPTTAINIFTKIEDVSTKITDWMMDIFENPRIIAKKTICLIYSRVNLEILEALGS